MRQFVYIVVTAYIVVGVGTGLVFYEKRQTPASGDAGRSGLVAESVAAALFWPLHINAVLTGHDARNLS